MQPDLALGSQSDTTALGNSRISGCHLQRAGYELHAEQVALRASCFVVFIGRVLYCVVSLKFGVFVPLGCQLV